MIKIQFMRDYLKGIANIWKKYKRNKSLVIFIKLSLDLLIKILKKIKTTTSNNLNALNKKST
jgi:hypothetical protein